MYEDYKNNQIDDAEDWERLKNELSGKDILLIAPGATVTTYFSEIRNYIMKETPLVIGVNFIPDGFHLDYAFFSNNKRFANVEKNGVKIIVTSNLTEGDSDFKINYNQVSGAFNQGCNSFIMCLKLLKNLDVKSINVAGADGYKEGGNNYFNADMKSSNTHGNKFNLSVIDAIHALDVKVNFITPSEYNK